MYILYIILTFFIPLFIFFKFIGRRTIVFINGAWINVNNSNNNNNNNNNNDGDNSNDGDDNNNNNNNNIIITTKFVSFIRGGYSEPGQVSAMKLSISKCKFMSFFF